MSDHTDLTASGVARRSVVRAGVTAVWTAPLVMVATSAPAVAASGCNAALQINNFTVVPDYPKQQLVVQVGSIRNKGTGPSGRVTAVLRIPKAVGALSAAPQLLSGPGLGWTYIGRTGSGPWDYTFLSSAGLDPKRWTKPIKLKLRLANRRATPQILLTVMAGSDCATPANASCPTQWTPSGPA